MNINRRLRFNDEQRLRLAAKAKGLGRRTLAALATIVTPETLLARHRKLIAQKYDGTSRRGPGRPRTEDTIESFVIQMVIENRDWGTPGSSAGPPPQDELEAIPEATLGIDYGC